MKKVMLFLQLLAMTMLCTVNTKYFLVQIDQAKNNNATKSHISATSRGSTTVCTSELREWAKNQNMFCAGLNWGTVMKKPAQHCTNGAAWSFFLLTGKDYRRFSNKDVVAIGGEAKDKNKELQKFKTGPLKKEGVYWGRVCNGNKNGKSPVDNPEGCFHSFSMTIGDNGVAIYQTMQAAFAMDHEFGIKRYPKDEFAEKISIATTETTRTGRNKEFHEIFWYEPGEEHSLEETGAPQVILNGPFPDKCSEIPKLAEFDFVRGKHNWGEKVFHPNQHKVDWPITKIHSADTMGEGGFAERGWMKNWFCICYEEAEKAKKSCSIL